MESSTLEAFRPHGTTGDGNHSDLFYHEEITGPQGARYHLFKEKHHTTEDVERAKNWLKINFDVVKIYITNDAV